MTTEENKETMRQVIKEFNGGNYRAFYDALDPECEVVFWTGEKMGKEELGGFMDALIHACPDVNLQLEDMVAEGDRVVTRFIEKGTMKESLFGMEPTGKHYEIPSMEIFHITNGKITQMWAGVWLTRDLRAVIESQIGEVRPSDQAA